MNLNKEVRKMCWKCQGALICIEPLEKRTNFNEIILTALENYYGLIKDDSEEAYRKAFPEASK